LSPRPVRARLRRGGFVPKKVFAQKKVTVKYTLGWLPEGANIWSYAAKQFWTKAGIDVVIEKGTGSAAATQAIAQGKYEFGIPAAPNSIQQAVKGLPLLSLGCFNYDTTMGVAVRPESPIKAPADLKGKKVGSTLTSGESLPAGLPQECRPHHGRHPVDLARQARCARCALIDNQCDDHLLCRERAFPRSRRPASIRASSSTASTACRSTPTRSPPRPSTSPRRSAARGDDHGLSEGVKFALLNPAQTIEILFRKCPS
jgi:hypothetical protein